MRYKYETDTSYHFNCNITMLSIILCFSAALVLVAGKYTGVIPVKQGGRVGNGEPIPITERPFQVFLLKFENIGPTICGGVILSENKILTAAHCVYKIDKVNVGVGSDRPNEMLMQESDLIAIHGKYNPENSVSPYDYDVGMITLYQPLNFGPTVKPIALTEAQPNAGEIAIVSGFGRASPGGGIPAEVLLAAKIEIFDIKVCVKYYEPGIKVTHRMICAGQMAGVQNACNGDSGGPLTVDGKLVGLVSWGDPRFCGDAVAPVAYTNIADPEIREFIVRNL